MESVVGNRMAFGSGYTLSGDRRCLNAVAGKVLPAPYGPKAKTLSNYNTFDPDSKSEIDGGILKDSVIQIAPGRGKAYTYAGLRRHSSTEIDVFGRTNTTNYDYYDDDIIKRFAGNNEYAERKLDGLRRITDYEEGVSQLYTTHEYRHYNENSWPDYLTEHTTHTAPPPAPKEDNSETKMTQFTGPGAY